MQIEHSKLEVGKHVWYDYENSEYPASGPFKITGFFNDHEGRHVKLSNFHDERNVLLASDDDYGQPRFYNSKPKTD